MTWRIQAGRPRQTQEALRVPGDKSISHRALMIAALADSPSSIRNIGLGADVASTAGCIRSLSVQISREENNVVVGGGGFRQPSTDLDAGNSGTTMRLLSGLLAGHPFSSVLSGDGSLSARPMERVAVPLRCMGASVETVEGHAPIRIIGGTLSGITFRPETPSAQVKSCVVLAGMLADGETTIDEQAKTRDHTERMLAAAGVSLQVTGNRVKIPGGQRPAALDMTVPGDFSSAAFLLTLGALTEPLTVRSIGVNPTRTRFLDVLRRMGAQIDLSSQHDEGGEPVADITVIPGDLTGTTVSAEESPLLIDELPLVALLGSLARGETVVRGAAELRFKESDRITTVGRELSALGARFTDQPDGFTIEGVSKLVGTHCRSQGDHRVGMMLAIAGAIATGETIIEDTECVGISFPGFADVISQAGVAIEPA